MGVFQFGYIVLNLVCILTPAAFFPTPFFRDILFNIFHLTTVQTGYIYFPLVHYTSNLAFQVLLSNKMDYLQICM